MLPFSLCLKHYVCDKITVRQRRINAESTGDSQMGYARCELLISAIKDAAQYCDYGHMQGTGGIWKRADQGKNQNGGDRDSSLLSTKHCGIKSKALSLRWSCSSLNSIFCLTKKFVSGREVYVNYGKRKRIIITLSMAHHIWTNEITERKSSNMGIGKHGLSRAV